MMCQVSVQDSSRQRASVGKDVQSKTTEGLTITATVQQLNARFRKQKRVYLKKIYFSFSIWSKSTGHFERILVCFLAKCHFESIFEGAVGICFGQCHACRLFYWLVGLFISMSYFCIHTELISWVVSWQHRASVQGPKHCEAPWLWQLSDHSSPARALFCSRV